MIPNYIPILKALGSEAVAVQRLDPGHAEKMLPLFEVPRIGLNISEGKRFIGLPLKTAYLDEIIGRISTIWPGRSAMVDVYHWAADATIESGEHVIPYIYNRLLSLGTDVVPVVGYDRWENQQYSLALEGLNLDGFAHCCLRLDSHAIDDAAEPDFFLDNVNGMLAAFQLTPQKCSVLVDFGDVAGRTLEQMIDQFDRIYQLLSSLGFTYIATAGCSLPSSIDKAVKTPDTAGTVVRKEMLLWQSARQQYPKLRLVYGDYGVRGPSSNEGVRNPHGNGKIRHTIDKHFFVVRGHSMKLANKGEQMWDLAAKLVNSQHYLGPGFSWGDQRILDCHNKKFKGHHTQWISNDTSHHLAYAMGEIQNFELSVAPAKSAVSESGKGKA